MPHFSAEKSESTQIESTMASTLSPRSNIRFSTKKILFENESQRKEKVKKIIELKKQEMEKTQKELHTKLSQILYETTIQREKEIAEKLACLEAEEEEAERQQEMDRKNEIQKQRIKESEEIFKQIIPFQEKLHAKWTDIANLLKTCQDNVSATNSLNQYSSKLKDLSAQMEAINEKAKTGDLTTVDVKMAEIYAECSNEIYLLFKEDVDEIDASYQRELEQREKDLAEAALAAQNEKLQIEQIQHLKEQNANTAQPNADISNTQSVCDQQSTETVNENVNIHPTAITNTPITPTTVPAEYNIDQMHKYLEISLDMFFRSHQFLKDYIQSYQEFAYSDTTKKFKFECQKSLNLAVNAISHASREQLVDKLERLKCFLSGKGTPNISSNPQAQNYSKCLLAQKIVEQGDTSISSKPELAFPFAAIAVALWNDWPDFGDLLLAFFRTKCPFFIPFFVVSEPNQPEDDYMTLIGWKCIENGEYEKPEQYWKRIGGMMYLYASIIVTKQRQGVSKPHPHGLGFAWKWLAATINIDPTSDTADIFATLIFTMLDVAGNDLWKAYPNQFPKLLLGLKNHYYKKLNSFDSLVKAPVVRLGELLDSAIKNRCIPPHKGQLPPGFW